MDRPTRTVNAARALALGAMLLLPGCSVFDSPIVQRGNRVTDDMLAQITPGVQTRQDVQALLGSPTQSSTFGDGSWYYISSTTRARPGRELAVTDQRTVVVQFDERGVVREVKTLGAEDGQPVTMVDRETPTPGNERTLLQALFGNVGRIGPGAAQAGSATGPGTAAPGQIR